VSRSKKDQRGGHRSRKFGTYSCMCCPILSLAVKAENRTTRTRALNRDERRAEGA
jgi:hypothetical protein